MQKIHSPLFILIVAIISRCQVEPYSQIGTTTSGTSILYNSNSVSLPQGTPASRFSILYSTPRQTNPQIAITVIGYEERGDVSDSYFKLSLTSSNLMSITLELLTAGSSQVYMMRVTYMAIQDIANAFYCLWVEYPSFTTVNTGSGSRSQNKISSFFLLTGGGVLNNNTSLNRAYAYITGFEIQAVSGNFGVELSVTLTNAISFTATIKASQDCRIQFLQGMFIFIDTGKFVSPTLFDYTAVITDSSTPIGVEHLASLGHTLFGIFHLKAAGTRTAGAVIKLDLTITNLTVSIQVSSFMQKVQYTYLFLGLKQCPSLYPFYTSSALASCIFQCPSTQSQSPTSGICITCTYPCTKCYLTPTNCSQCITDYQLSGNTCTAIVITKTPAMDSKIYLLGLLGIIPISIVRNFGYILAGCLPMSAQTQAQVQQKINDVTTQHRIFLNITHFIRFNFFLLLFYPFSVSISFVMTYIIRMSNII